MIKILFVCHGNICRSPMAEYVLKDMARAAGLADELEIASAATSREELGNDMYPPAKAVLRAHGVPFGRHRARQIAAGDFEYYDHIIVMEQRQLMALAGRFPAAAGCRLSRLLDHSARPGDVSDPWYTGDFETAYRDIREGCEGLLKEICTTRFQI